MADISEKMMNKANWLKSVSLSPSSGCHQEAELLLEAVKRIEELDTAKKIGIQACDLLKERIEELGVELLDTKAAKIESDNECCVLRGRIAKLEALKDTVLISCNPPKDCNSPKVLKRYMKACFEQATLLC